ncbi:MAG: nuclear transport factor 2 family protein [Actinomycetota bacterium]
MTPAERITAYFDACSTATAAEIAAHFTPDAVVYDTNVRPARGAHAIGAMWVKVRERWGGAVWGVDSVISSADDSEAAIEWQMTGTDVDADRPFVFRGSEHYRFDETLIAEIRQYWTFDPDALDTGLRDFDYS